jgi:hypothetical protein
MRFPLVGALRPASLDDPVQQSLIRAIETRTESRFRYQLAWHYYRGDVYKWLREQHSVEAAHEKAGHPLELSAYFNPVKEIVDVDVAKVFASPVSASTTDTVLDARLNALWTRSRFETLLRKYVQGGAAQGKVYLHVLDGVQSKVVVRRADEIDVLKHPQTGEIVAAKITVEVWDPLGIEGDQREPGVATGEGGEYTYDWVMTPNWYGTFKNRRPWAFSDNPTDANGMPLALWANRLGFVPIREVLHMDDGEGDGANAWEAVKETIDQANTIATFMANTVKMHIDPLIFVYGVDSGEVEKKMLNGQTNVFFIKFPEMMQGVQPKIELMEWKGNVTDVTGFIEWVKNRLVDVIPELQLSRIQDQANPAGYSVALQSMGLHDHVMALRTTYFEGLVWADRVALWAEDVHTGTIDPLRAVATLQDETQYAHGVNVGALFPKNVDEETRVASTMLRDGVIDKIEYLIRCGYSLPEAKALVQRAVQEAEDNMNRQMAMQQSLAEAAALRDGGSSSDGANTDASA